MDFGIRLSSGSVHASLLDMDCPLNGGDPIGQYVYHAYRNLSNLRVGLGDYHVGKAARYKVKLEIRDVLILEPALSSWPTGGTQVQVYRGILVVSWKETFSLAANIFRIVGLYRKPNSGAAEIPNAVLTLRYGVAPPGSITGDVAQFSMSPALPGARPELMIDLRANMPLITGDPNLIQDVDFPVTSVEIRGTYV